MLNRRRNHTSLRRESGQSAVEFALVAPVLIAVLLGIVQAGIAFHDYITVTDAARAAARKAVTARVSGLSITDVQQAAKDAAGDLDPNKINVTVDDPTDPTFAN